MSNERGDRTTDEINLMQIDNETHLIAYRLWQSFGAMRCDKSTSENLFAPQRHTRYRTDVCVCSVNSIAYTWSLIRILIVNPVRVIVRNTWIYWINENAMPRQQNCQHWTMFTFRTENGKFRVFYFVSFLLRTKSVSVNMIDGILIASSTMTTTTSSSLMMIFSVSCRTDVHQHTECQWRKKRKNKLSFRIHNELSVVNRKSSGSKQYCVIDHCLDVYNEPHTAWHIRICRWESHVKLWRRDEFKWPHLFEHARTSRRFAWPKEAMMVVVINTKTLATFFGLWFRPLQIRSWTGT